MAYARIGKLNEAEMAADEFRAEIGISSARIYNALSAGYGLNNQFELAFDLIRAMIEEDIQPTAITFNRLVNIAGEYEDKVLIEKILVEMMKSGLSPDPVTYCVLNKFFYESEIFGG